MNFLKFLFGKKDKPSKAVKPIPFPQAKHHQAVSENFSTSEWVVNEAFDKVFSQITVDNGIKSQFKKAYCAAHQSGNPRQEEKAAVDYLMNSNWIWHDFDKWFDFFSQKGVWPYMWRRNKLTEKPHQVNPGSIQEAISYLNVKEMREFLKNHNIKVKPAPKKREEFEKAIIQNSTFPDVINAIKGHLQVTSTEQVVRFNKAKCQLLAHTLAMTAYSLRDHYQRQDINSFRLVAEKSGGTCKIEDEFATKFNTNKIVGVPPFFPGDRTTITCKIK